MIKKAGYLLYRNKRVKFALEIRTTASRQKGSFFSGSSIRDDAESRKRILYFFNLVQRPFET